MRHATERGHLVIGLGDFNMRPKSLAHKVIETHGHVKDVWREVHPDSSLGSTEDELEKRRKKPMPSADFNIAENGTTCDSILNTWRWNKGRQRRLDKGETITVSGSDPDPRGKRLDYIFFGTGESTVSNDAASQSPWRVESASVGMMERHPSLQCSLSDHFSIATTITRSLPSSSSFTSKKSLTTDNTADSIPFLPPQIYTDILALTSAYSLRERRQGHFRLYHLLGQIGISIGCLVAVWWSPRNFVAFILMLVSTLGLSLGIVQGLMGGLFNASEERCLREFEWEIRQAKEAAKNAEGREKGV